MVQVHCLIAKYKSGGEEKCNRHITAEEHKNLH
jgi:hypothetical protein